MKTDKVLITQFLSLFPPAHAIPRINEALAIKNFPLSSPSLDFGCGDGQFAKILYGKKKIDMGLDSNTNGIKKAMQIQAYQAVVVENGKSMSFSSGEFRTVLANSVLEHIHDLDQVLAELNRVMAVDGNLIITVPTPLVSKYLFFRFIPGYSKFKEKLWRHYNYFGESEWKKRLVRAGFRIQQTANTNSVRAIAIADLFLPLFPFGRLPFVYPLLKKMHVFGNDKGGATLVLVAIKKTNVKN